MNIEDARKIIFEEIGFCGCGNPEDALDLVRESLVLMSSDKDTGDPWGKLHSLLLRDEQQGLFHMFLYGLERADLIEHGSSIACSWTTPKGDLFLQFLLENTSEQIFDYGEENKSPD